VLVAAPRVATAPPVVAQASPYVGNVPKDWIPLPGAHRDWYYIVIHHSATPSGSMKEFDREHKEKGWDECGYDFVIGNGTGSGNGQIEVGPRWPVQKYGAHAKTPDERYNEHGIGICLVGNFDLDHPTASQVASLERLVTYLIRTYHIPDDATHVVGHRDTKQTDCPGKNFDVAAIRRAVATKVADVVSTTDTPAFAANTELMHSTP
jgi:hypothetical protein